MEIELRQTQFIRLSLLEPNDGQVEGLPKNPRKISADDLERLKNSITKHPDFLALRELVVYPHGGKYVVLGGNMRLRAMRQMKFKEAPCKVVPEGTAIEDLKTFAALDNGSFGSWDYDALANEWDDLPLVDLGIPAWEPEQDWTRDGLSSEGREGADGYDEFVDKFAPKLTTDDCYTPPAVYDAVLKFVGTLTDLEGRKVERPFVPGGDYENYAYTPRSIVVDNPPFSILSQICRFYSERGIPFFLFAPALTLFTATDCDLTYIVANAPITYENGAVVSTGFVTNIISDIRIWCCPELGHYIEEAQPDEDKTKQGFVYPDNIVTAAILGKIVKRDVELKIYKASCEAIKESDSAKAQGRGLFGGGFIMSDRAAAERAAAERAAAERAAATRLSLSDREKEIIARLNEADAHLYAG